SAAGEGGPLGAGRAVHASAGALPPARPPGHRQGTAMFVVWRRRAVTSDRPTELFNEYFFGRKLNGVTSADAPAWTPPRCAHAGPGGASSIPRLLHSQRRGGPPRQVLLRRLPAVRSCCLTEPFLVAAWWHAVAGHLRFLAEEDDGVAGRHLARDRGAVLA